MKPSPLVRELTRIVGPDAVLWRAEDLMLYEYDALSSVRPPDAVVFPMTTEHVVGIVRLAAKEKVPVIARGAGTGLSGGAVVTEGGIVVSFARMKKIVEIDIENERARVQPGVVNLDLSLAVADYGYYFVPDPSSQKACTIGGNVAENSGGPHTLAYGVTTNHVLGLEVVGLREAVDEQADEIETVCRENCAREVRRARTEEERDLLWKGRKNAFGALGRISPAFYVQDGVIPRTRLPEMLEHIEQAGRKYNLVIGNIFHAGDGNLHPLLMFDNRDPEQSRRVLKAAEEILAKCVEMGGALTGEHGVGIEKNELMPLLFSADDLDMMRKLKAVFNPTGMLNPGKVLPTGKMCGELRVQVSSGTQVMNDE